MKIRSLAIVAAAFIVTAVATPALAMYHPGMGRFLQRDPHGTMNASTAPRVGMAGPAAAGGFVARDPMPARPQPILQYTDGMNLYQYVRSQPTRGLDPTGMWWWDGDYIQYGVGGLLGFHGREAAGAAWSEGSKAYSRACYGVVGAGTGGLFDSDYGFGGSGDSWYQLQDDVAGFIDNAGYGDLRNDPGYTSGTNGARVAEAAILSAGALQAAGYGGFSLRPAIHAPHAGGPHQYWHFQLNWWTQGVKGSGGVWRFPALMTPLLLPDSSEGCEPPPTDPCAEEGDQ